MREETLIKRIKFLIDNYFFSEPFSIYLKDYFRKHPEMGARDRRETREWAFNYLRIGKNLPEHPFEVRLAVANFLCSSDITDSCMYLLKNYSTFEISGTQLPLDEKLKIVQFKFPEFFPEGIFPMNDQLSPSINIKSWNRSFLVKPRIWIRMRKAFAAKVVEELKEKQIKYYVDEDPYILSFDFPVSLEITDSYKKGFFEIQDKSSQLTKSFFQPHSGESWWDACAGSGGKSLLLAEECESVKIYATDTRPKILENYSSRMKKTGFKSFQTHVMDLGKSEWSGPEEKFDGIIADVPCSGSGTWSRSPEWLQKNITDRIKDHFVPAHRNIITNILPALKKGFPLIYITCSVFKMENEENIQFFTDHLPLKLEKSAYLEGYDSKGDTLFVARFLRDR